MSIDLASTRGSRVVSFLRATTFYIIAQENSSYN